MYLRFQQIKSLVLIFFSLLSFQLVSQINYNVLNEIEPFGENTLIRVDDSIIYNVDIEGNILWSIELEYRPEHDKVIGGGASLDEFIVLSPYSKGLFNKYDSNGNFICSLYHSFYDPNSGAPPQQTALAPTLLHKNLMEYSFYFGNVSGNWKNLVHYDATSCSINNANFDNCSHKGWKNDIYIFDEYTELHGAYQPVDYFELANFRFIADEENCEEEEITSCISYVWGFYNRDDIIVQLHSQGIFVNEMKVSDIVGIYGKSFGKYSLIIDQSGKANILNENWELVTQKDLLISNALSTSFHFNGQNIMLFSQETNQINISRIEIDQDDVLNCQASVDSLYFVNENPLILKIVPIQEEIIYNGYDDDCNPLTLDDDLDQDGFVLADDCNDLDPSINPNADEVFNNNIDENCDGFNEQDEDGDLYGNLTDCNEQDPAINPGQAEVFNNNIDENCDGVAELDADEDGYGHLSDCDDSDPALQNYIIQIGEPKILEALIELGIDQNGNNTIECFETNNIDTLIIKNKWISDISGIEEFTDLKYLDLSSNNWILDIQNLSSLTLLETLNLSSSDVEHFSINLPNLKTLDLSRNELISFSASLPNAEFIDLSGNELMEFPYNYPNLKTLDLSRNELISFSASLPSAEIINLQGNKLVTFSSNIPNIRNLNISRNIIQNISINDYPDLEDLDLSDNSIVEIKLNNLPKLRRLILASNDIEEIDLEEYPELEYLSLSDNLLKEFEISNYPLLEYVSFKDNLLSNVKISSLPTLKYLYLSRNELSNIDLGHLDSLLVLSLNQNKIEKIQLPNLPSLTSIGLSNNKISSINLNNYLNLSFVGLSWNDLKYLYASNLEQLFQLDVRFNFGLTDLYINNGSIEPSIQLEGTNLNFICADEEQIEELLESPYIKNDTEITSICAGDLDNDGVDNDNDCDDTNPDINNFAVEIFNNTIDENCDGIAEMDIDADGYGNLSDCDDNDPSVHPGAMEIFNNGIDENCDSVDESDFDQDGIGELYDCDDNNSQVQTEIVEIPNSFFRDAIFENGVDINLNGMIECYEARLVDSLHISNMSPLSEITGIQEFINLKYLDLNRNRILNISQLENLIQLEYLDISSNRIEDIAPLTGLSNLIKLDISDNELIDVSNLQDINQLEYLDISRNMIEVISFTEEFNQLEYLDFSNNSILEVNLENLGALKYIDISYNQLAQIQIPFLADLDTLRGVNIGAANIPIDFISSLPSLQYLNLGFNSLESFETPSFPKLKNLILENNELQSLEEIATNSLSQLTNLNADFNRLNEINGSNYPMLENLSLRGNEFSNIELSFPNLTVAILESNQIEQINLLDVPKLEKLNLGDNKLGFVDFPKLDHLAELYIFNNPIKYLYTSHLESLSKLILKDNTHLEKLFIQNGIVEDLGSMVGLDTIEVECEDSEHTFGYMTGLDSLEFICADSDQIVELIEILGEELIITDDCPGDIDMDYVDDDSDCDDNNPNVNINVSEIPFNGIDDDCNPLTLDNDGDQDGFDEYEDCDDSNAEINPQAEEVIYDGIDNDCSAATLDDDLDQDGFDLELDCNDNNSDIYPGAPEIPENGIDEDCDGEDTILSSTDEKETSVFTLFPNPALDQLYIKSEVNISDITMFSIDGKRIIITLERNVIDLSHLKSGMYMCKITFETGEKQVRKVLVL